MPNWKTINNFETYEVSDQGEIRNLKSGRILKQSIHPTLGYCYLGLSKEGKVKSFYTHRLVAQTFIEKPEGKDWVLHRDGIKTNNVFTNLYWGTPKDNTGDSKLHGTIRVKPGINNPTAKLDENQLKFIWESILKGDSNIIIAQSLPVSSSRISEIRHFKTYTQESKNILKILLDK